MNNYLKITWRTIQKNKLYSFVNIMGLTVGITGCILIGLYIWNEVSYDKFHQNANRIARVTMEGGSSGSEREVAVTGTKVGPEFKRTFPQVEAFTRTMKYARSLSYGGKTFDEKNLLYADEDFFRIFSFNMLQGNAATALNAPYKIIFTKTAARKYFGDENPIGKTVRINDIQDYEVTGVTDDVPLNSQIRFDMVVSFTSLGAAREEETWWNANYITYLLLKQPDQLSGLQKQVTRFMQKVTTDLKMDKGEYLNYNLEPLLQVHLHSQLDGLEPNGNITYIYVLAAIAILISLIACVNYTNLATAQAAGRGTEIGIRKVLGAGKGGLFKQFMGESFTITFMALVLSVMVSMLLLPVFNQITGKTFTAGMLLNPLFLFSILLSGAIIGLLAGFYPAFILTHSGLTGILKSGLRVSSSGGGLRKSLIIFQFVTAVFLITTTIIVVQQVAYIQNKDLGYKREQVLVMPVDNKMKAGYDALKKAIMNNPGVVSVTGAYEDPTFIEWGDFIRTGSGQNTKKVSITGVPVDLDYIKTMGMQLKTGRDFINSDFALHDTSNDYKNYQHSFILNEKAAHELGWTAEEAIGKIITKGAPGEIRGVVENFHFASMHNPIGPLVMFLDSTMVRQLFVKISGDNIPATLQVLENTWKARVTHRPFNYHFLDEDFNVLYSIEQRTARLFILFSGLAIALACLGLFALAAYTTVQRTKEIGIRKVLGAGITDITVLVSKDFIKLVMIAIVIAAPLGWLAGNKWLQDFEYRIPITAGIFIIAAVIAIGIALFTVSFQAIKAAVANPVKSLRSE
jgi:putative ABC transport system permease protein